jgi:nitroreductase
MKMQNKSPWKLELGLLFLVLLSFPGWGSELKPIVLPKPQMHGGKPLLEALKDRKTVRDFRPGNLEPQMLGNLLWAAFGINRPENDHRTAPSAMNSQEVRIYVALREGVYLYEPKAHALQPVLGEDLRARTGGQPFAKDAAAVLIYVADLPRLEKAKPDTRPFYAGIDTGCIVQNVYLFCASEGLGAVVYDLNRDPLSVALNLGPEQKIILAQAVGYPKPPLPSSSGASNPN